MANLATSRLKNTLLNKRAFRSIFDNKTSDIHRVLSTVGLVLSTKQQIGVASVYKYLSVGGLSNEKLSVIKITVENLCLVSYS